ncbi:MAG: exonuclease domain-containing protein [Candidatus Omnitrophota bacterium]
MDRIIDEVEFTLFDTETTGLEPKSGDRIVEIAALRFKAAERIASFQSLVNPGRPISEAAFNVNHISQEMLKGAPSIDLVMPGFLEFIKGSCLLSYNAVFDLEFLNNELKMLNLPALTDVVVMDILKMARRGLPNLERYALWFVAQYLGLGAKQEHRAFSDVELSFGVYQRLKQALTNKGITHFTHFASLFGIKSAFLENIINQKIAEIQEAINLQVKLKIKYVSSSGAVTEREIMPKQIRQENKYFYLVAHCCLRDEERTFRIDGILHLEIL